MIPSSITRFVDAMNAIGPLKSAPFPKSERASPTAAYEQDDEAAPSPHGIATEGGESSGRSRRHLAFRDDRLRDGGEEETEDQRPEDLPEHPEGERERLEQSTDDAAHVLST
jgi:hypothetical protein